jgi:agmatinase
MSPATLSERLHQQQASRLALIGLPLDVNSSFFRGAAEAPPLIREALFSEATNLSTESGQDLGTGSPLLDLGDLDLASIDSFEPPIEEAISLILRHALRPVSLGGDHSVTIPAVAAVASRFGPIDLILFDAHADLYDRFQDSPVSHACVFARIMERGHARRLVQIGIRTMNKHQREQAERFGVQVIEMRDWQACLSLGFDRPTYVSIDVDVLDPAYAPGVSHREPGGPSTRQLIEAIQGIAAPIVGADVVEYNPRRDLAGLTAPLCAKLVKEIAARMLTSPDPSPPGVASGAVGR